MPNDKAISLDNLQTFKTNCDSTYATKTELTEGLAGKQPTGNYALQTGTYPNMTAGNATNADNVTDTINGKAITDIFEADGTRVQEATHAISADSATDAANADNAIHATTADRATNDGLGNNISNSYVSKSKIVNNSVNGTLIWGSGWIDFKRSGNVCICTFELSTPSTVAAWSNQKIANYPSGYSNGYGTVVGAGQMDSVDNMVPMEVAAFPDGIYICGDAHTIDSNRHTCGFVVWLMGNIT